MNKRDMKVKRGDLIAKKKVKLVKFSLKRNISTLQKMIRGCEEADVETLFRKSIDHIMKLKLQVHILKCLLQVYEIN